MKFKKVRLMLVFGSLMAGVLFFLQGVAGAQDEKKITQKEMIKAIQNLYPIDRRISYSFTLENKTGQAIKNAQFWTYAPVKQTATQFCRAIISSHDHETILDDAGNQILYYTFDLIPPYGSKIVSITAELRLSENPNSFEMNSTTMNPAPRDMAPYLQSELYIESDHPLVIKTAGKLKEPTVFETIKKTYKWVAGKIKYAGYISRDRGALYALKHGRGDCTEYMYLFTALCRVNQIPARGMGGYVCRANTILKPSGYHNWVEVFHDNLWQTVDPQEKVIFGKQAAYIAMKIMGQTRPNGFGGFHRFRVKGNGLTVKMNG